MRWQDRISVDPDVCHGKRGQTASNGVEALTQGHGARFLGSPGVAWRRAGHGFPRGRATRGWGGATINRPASISGLTTPGGG